MLGFGIKLKGINMYELNESEIATVAGASFSDALIRAAVNGVKRYAQRILSPGPTI